MPESNRVQLWSCGGGRQSAGVAALMVLGRLPLPDHAVMVDTNREKSATFRYLDAHIRPAMDRLGVPFTLIDRAKYATKDLWGGEGGKSLLLPAYTNQSGRASKLPEFCSGEWKRDVVMRWAAGQEHLTKQMSWKQVGVDNWLGISADESRRRRGPRRKWIRPVYPLLDVLPMRVPDLLAAVAEVGWPEPPRSSCWMCPNQSDAEWGGLSPDEWEMACDLDEYVRTIDSHAFLHKQLIPLRQVKLNPKADAGLFSGGCSSGMCY